MNQRVRTFHTTRVAQFEGRDEGEEERLDRLKALSKSQALDKVKHSNLPLAKYV